MTKKPLHLHNLKKKKKKTGTPKTFDKLWTDLRNITADMFLAGANAANCNLKHSGWRCGEYAYSPGDWELFGIDFMFDADFKPWVLEVRSFLLLIFSSSFLRFWFIFGRRGLAGLHGERRRRKCGRRARPRSGARRRKEALFALSLFLERRRSPFDRRRSKARSKKKEREGNSRSGRWDRSSRSLSLSFSLARSMRKEKEETNALSSRSARRGTRSSFLRSLFFRGGRRRSKTREKKTHSLTLFFFSLSLPFHHHHSPPQPPQVNASPAIKRRAFWNSDYSDYPPESDYATLGREYDAQNAAVVDAYARLLQETTVRSAWKRPGCTARTCSPYTEGACSPESKECKTEAEMARKVGFVPLFGDGPSPRAEMAGKEMKA